MNEVLRAAAQLGAQLRNGHRLLAHRQRLEQFARKADTTWKQLAAGFYLPMNSPMRALLATQLLYESEFDEEVTKTSEGRAFFRDGQGIVYALLRLGDLLRSCFASFPSVPVPAVTPFGQRQSAMCVVTGVPWFQLQDRGRLGIDGTVTCVSQAFAVPSEPLHGTVCQLFASFGRVSSVQSLREHHSRLSRSDEASLRQSCSAFHTEMQKRLLTPQTIGFQRCRAPFEEATAVERQMTRRARAFVRAFEAADRDANYAVQLIQAAALGFVSHKLRVSKVLWSRGMDKCTFDTEGFGILDVPAGSFVTLDLPGCGATDLLLIHSVNLALGNPPRGTLSGDVLRSAASAVDGLG